MDRSFQSSCPKLKSYHRPKARTCESNTPYQRQEHKKQRRTADSNDGENPQLSIFSQDKDETPASRKQDSPSHFSIPTFSTLEAISNHAWHMAARFPQSRNDIGRLDSSLCHEYAHPVCMSLFPLRVFRPRPRWEVCTYMQGNTSESSKEHISIRVLYSLFSLCLWLSFED